MELNHYILIGGALILIFSLYGRLSQPLSEIGAVRKKYKPNLTWFGAYLRRKSAKQRVKLLRKLTDEEQWLANREHAEPRRQEARELEILSHQERIRGYETRNAQSDLMLDILGWSRERGVDTATYLKMQEAAEHDRREMQKRWMEIQQDLRAGFILEQKHFEHFKFFRGYINELFDERALIEVSNDPAKMDKLRVLNLHLKQMEQDFYDNQKRLHKAPDRKELPGGNADSDFPGGLR